MEMEEESSENQPNNSIAGQMEEDSTAFCNMPSQILDKESGNNNNNETKETSLQNQLEIVESERMANVEDSMEWEGAAITFSECPDISWVETEASDVIYTFSELG